MTEFDRMLALLESSWCVRDEVVPCLVGPPGIGKTAAVMRHAKNHDAHVVKIVASRCVPSETVGMTMPDHEHRGMTIYNSMQLSSLRDGDILFLDELLEAEQFVLSTLLTVIESREMADGTPLPDIQIIAATNDTIPPTQLRGNIKQRFMFREFGIDYSGTRKYIKDLTGINVTDDILSKIVNDGDGYNFLSSRSLTKLCVWISRVDESQLDDTATVINGIWGNMIGTTLATLRRQAEFDPEKQVRKVIKDMLPDMDFSNSTISDMLTTLQEMPEWEEIADRLSREEIVKPMDPAF